MNLRSCYDEALPARGTGRQSLPSNFNSSAITILDTHLVQSASGYEVFYPFCSWRGYLVPNASLHWMTVRLLQRFMLLTVVVSISVVILAALSSSGWPVLTWPVLFFWHRHLMRRVSRRMPALSRTASFRFYARWLSAKVVWYLGFVSVFGAIFIIYLSMQAIAFTPMQLFAISAFAIWFAALLIVRFRFNSTDVIGSFELKHD